MKQFLINLTKNNWQIILFCIVHIVIFLIVFQSGVYGWTIENDVMVDYPNALRMYLGELPYLDFNVEYPPLAMLFAYLPIIFSPYATIYLWSYITELLIFDIIGIFFIKALAEELHLNRWKTLGFYTLAILAIGPIITARLDIIPAIITLIALYFFIKGHHKTAFVFLAIGTCIKFYPVILVPLFLIYLWKNQQIRKIFTGIASFAITGLIIILPALILSTEGLWHSLTYHAERGLQIESTYASILELCYSFGIIPLEFEDSYGSTNLISTLADNIANISFVFIVLGLLAVYWFFYKRLKNTPCRENTNPLHDYDKGSIIVYSIITILIFILTNKVFSPQYIIWLLPFIVLITGKTGKIPILLFIMIGLMSFFIYPQHYKGIEEGNMYVILMLFARNSVLAILAYIVLRCKQESYNLAQQLNNR
jgi:uncharacterized membrane protein